jgi:hypothetical protein
VSLKPYGDATRRREPAGRVSAHFRRLASLSRGQFITRVSIESTALSLGLAVLLTAVWRGSEDSHILGHGLLGIVRDTLLVPLLETLLFQSLPVWVARRTTANTTIQVLAAWIPFAAAHFLNGIGPGLCAGIIGGFYLAFAYVVWTRRAHGQAIMVTTAIHGITNAVAHAVAVFA